MCAPDLAMAGGLLVLAVHAGLSPQRASRPSTGHRFGASLSDTDIVAVLSWIKSQWPADIQATHGGINRQAREAQR